MKKMQMENTDIFPTPPQGKNAIKQKQKQDSFKLDKMQNSDKKPENRKRSTSQEKSLENTPKDRTMNKLSEEYDKDKNNVAKNEMACLYKYSISKGNNALLVRSLFKNRFWWMIADKGADMKRVNFMWTQIKNFNYMDTLLCKYPEKKSGLGLKEKPNKTIATQQPFYPIDSLQAK